MVGKPERNGGPMNASIVRCCVTITPRRGPYLRPVGNIDMLIGYGRALQEMARVHGIHNVFDDNGYKDLILLTLFGLRKLGREGDDAVDAERGASSRRRRLRG